MIQKHDLTILERQAIENCYTENTGYVYFDQYKTTTERKTLEGVFSSLIRKGIIVPTYEQPFEAYPTEEYERWFF